MKRIVLFLCLSSLAEAENIELPHTLSNNTVADADEVMANFNALKNGVNSRIWTDLSNYNAVFGDGLQRLTPGTPEDTSGQYNTATGVKALYAITEGTNNTASGAYALGSTTTGSNNNASGVSALYNNTTGVHNVATGSYALFKNTEGESNTAIGNYSLYTNTTGTGNVANGAYALALNSEGEKNTAIGFYSLYDNTTGIFNVAVGADALGYNTTGDANVAVGNGALLSTTANSNTAVGFAALLYNEQGAGNTAIGYAAGVKEGDEYKNLDNTTAIGSFSEVDASNKVRIGNTNVTVIEGQVAFTSSSDVRLKDSITPVIDGLALVNDLNPVSYHRIGNPASDVEMGLLAQEVRATLEKHGLGNSGMVHQSTQDAYMSLRYNDLLAPIIKAIQELDVQHKREVATLEKRLKSQQDELLVIVQSQQEQIARLESMLERTLVAR